MEDATAELPPFKRASMMASRKRVWKSLKQVLATERTLQWPENAVTCKYILSGVFLKTILRIHDHRN